MLELLSGFSKYVFIITMVSMVISSYYLVISKEWLNEKSIILRYQVVMIIVFNIVGSNMIICHGGNYQNNLEQVKYLFGYNILIFAVLFIVYKGFKHQLTLIWNLCLYFLSIGVIMISRLNWHEGKKQIIWIAVGLGITLFVILMNQLNMPLEKFKGLYGLGVIILVLSPFLLGVEDGGSLNWVQIGQITFQPSEFVKILFLLYLAAEFEGKANWNSLIRGGIVTFVVLLSLLFQKDLGGALIFFMVFLMMTYFYLRREWVLIGGLVAGCAAAWVSFKSFSHVRVRVAGWLNPWDKIDREGYQITQSLFAISSGKWFGTGLFQGMPLSIPIVSTDFIFAAISEEMGNIFSIGLLLLYLVMVISSMNAAIIHPKKYFMNLGLGIGVLLGFQTFLIIGGVTKFIPLTGVTLPMISYGGSSILSTLILFGLIQVIYVKGRYVNYEEKK